MTKYSKMFFITVGGLGGGQNWLSITLNAHFPVKSFKHARSISAGTSQWWLICYMLENGEL